MTFSPPRCFRICAENRSSFEEEYISDSERKRETGIVVNSRFLPSEGKKKEKEEEEKGGGDLSRRSVHVHPVQDRC